MTGFGPLDRALDAWDGTPAGSKGRRILYALLFGLGLTLTGMGSIFFRNTGPIPLRFIPDLRIFLPFMTGFLMGLLAAGGGVSRRKPALWTAVGVIIAFHLEEATVIWIGPYPGSITGTRVGLLGTGGSLLALVSVLLLHVEAESTRLSRDLARRGADPDVVEEMRLALVGQGTRRVLGLGAAIAGFALVVRAGEAIFGNDAPGGDYVLLVGALLLLVLAAFLLRIAKPKSQPEADEAEPQEAA